jgi:hypothetical protein
VHIFDAESFWADMTAAERVLLVTTDREDLCPAYADFHATHRLAEMAGAVMNVLGDAHD